MRNYNQKTHHFFRDDPRSHELGICARPSQAQAQPIQWVPMRSRQTPDKLVSRIFTFLDVLAGQPDPE